VHLYQSRTASGSVLALSAVDRGFEPGRFKPKTKIGMRCFSDEVHFVLDQYAELDFYSASSMKQFAG
jgi:hypothetical protein